MKELAISRASVCDPADFAFWWRAVEIQLQRDVYPAWKHYLPLGEMPVCGYASVKDLAPNSTHTITVVDNIDDPQLAGYHSGLMAAGFAWGRSLPRSTVLSHEALELTGDPWCNLWSFNERDQQWYAREPGDPVERDTYYIEVELFGQSRLVEVSNFVYPAWFDMINHGDNRLDHMTLCTAPFEVRAGYAVVKDADKNVSNIYGSRADVARGLLKVHDPHSRTARRITP